MTQRNSSRSPTARLWLEPCEERIVPAHAARPDVSNGEARIEPFRHAENHIRHADLEARDSARADEVLHGRGRANGLLNHLLELGHSDDHDHEHESEWRHGKGSRLAERQEDDRLISDNSESNCGRGSRRDDEESAPAVNNPPPVANLPLSVAPEVNTPLPPVAHVSLSIAPAVTGWTIDPAVLAIEVMIEITARTRTPPPKGNGPPPVPPMPPAPRESGGAAGDKVSDAEEVLAVPRPDSASAAAAEKHSHEGKPVGPNAARAEMNAQQPPAELSAAAVSVDRSPLPAVAPINPPDVAPAQFAAAPAVAAVAPGADEAPPAAEPAAPAANPAGSAAQIAAAVQGLSPAAVTAADLVSRFTPFDPRAAEESVDRFLNQLRIHREAGESWLTRRHLALMGVAVAAGLSAGEVARRKQVPQRMSRFLSLNRLTGTRTI